MQRNSSFVQFLTTPTADTPGAAFALTFDNPPRSYLFGHVGEGLQRAAVQNGVRLIKFGDIFFTGRTEWSNIGGTLGFILSTTDVIIGRQLAAKAKQKEKAERAERVEKEGKTDGQGAKGELKESRKVEEVDRPEFRLHGARNLMHFLGTARRFIFRKGVPLHVTEYKSEEGDKDTDTLPEPSFADEFIKVWPVVAMPQTQSSRSTPSPHGRKRSLDEAEGRTMESRLTATDAEKAQQYDELRKAAVSAMFGSDWSMDALEEHRLVDVQLPAKLYIRDPETKDLKRYEGPTPGGDVDVSDVKVLVRKPWPGAKIDTLPPTAPLKDSVSYVIHQYEQRGRFMPSIAKNLGVPSGPLFSQLAAGGSIQLPNGKTITSDMVVEPGRPGRGVAVLDIPGPEYVQPLLSRSEWTNSQMMDSVSAFIWLLGPGVASNPDVNRFMEERSTLQHIVSSPDICHNRLSMNKAAMNTVRLKEVDPDRYELPHHEDQPLSNSLATNFTDGSAALPDFVNVADRGSTLRLEPNLHFSQETVAEPVDIAAARQSLSPTVLELVREAQANLEKDKTTLEQWKSTIPNPETEIITLGTGSALPSNHRNVSATLVRVPGHGSYLLDCGEGTLGQIKRVYGRKYKEVIKDLRMIWISHLHADHHLGTANVIKEWYALVHDSVPDPNPLSIHSLAREAQASPNTVPRRLAVVSEIGMHQWIAEYSQCEDIGYSRLLPLLPPATRSGTRPIQLITYNIPTPTSHPSDTQLISIDPLPTQPSTLQRLTGLHHLSAVLVRHCHHACAVALTWPDGLKIAYSGDCRPSLEFARIGRGATVCIHEATFGDELGGEAKAKLHSTSGEAVAVAREMRARACLLTHFSQRYAKVVPIDVVPEEKVEEEVEQAQRRKGVPEYTADRMDVDPPMKNDEDPDTRVAVAFDYMRVKVGDLAKLEYFLPALNELHNEPEPEPADEEGDDADNPAKPAKTKKQKDKKPSHQEKQSGKAKKKAAWGEKQRGNKKNKGDGGVTAVDAESKPLMVEENGGGVQSTG
ncbi:hypothetical protein P152DRAFT_398582 [Eremomyces bilateralis CBS 781.70]|uniref:ribonuclease Z n=1 Tax=Eremomyces bilateralis CBS 781.70 TaxID=1392243 RepID=A0A6G1G0Y4_9PEZI|nr:uncharacterized protein P152DRAFT_398582 [Eremomyces bilateralis CBS 781.70]KAF1811714.1 hypothetical protein P152DRAFT_398582 [Eremomyces bilateralis CBS 781.70]